MNNRYGSIYDSYRLSNSSAIPMYEGSAAPEALQVGQYEQGLYNTAQAGAFGVAGNLDNVQSLDADKALANDLRNGVAGKLKEFATRGDYENMVPAVQQLSTEFMNRARELALPMQQKQQWITDQVENKDKGLTPWQKAGLIAKADSEYTPLKKDATGRYVGGYKAGDVAENVDAAKWADDAMKEVAIQKGGSEWYSDLNGDFIIKYGDKREVLKKEQVAAILQNKLQMDPKMQAHISQMGDIAGFYASRLSDGNWSDKSKADIQTYIAKGYSLAQAKQAVGKQLQEDQIKGNILGYGVNKYQQNNHWTTQDGMFNPINLQAKLKEGEPPITVNGPDSNTSLEEQDFDKVSSNLNTWKSQAANFDKQIAQAKERAGDSTLSATARDQWSTKAAELEKQRMGVGLQADRYSQLMNYAKEQTATAKGYKDYNDYLNSASSKMEQSLRGIIGNKVIGTPSGVQVDAKSIGKAIADGRVFPTSVTIRGGGQVPDKVITTGMDMITEDGKKIHIGTRTMGPQLGDQVYKLLQDKTNKVTDFNSALKDNYKSNIANYAFHSNYWTLNDQQTESLSKAVNVGGAQGILLTKPGEFTEIPENATFGVSRKDFASYKATGVKSVSPDGTVTVAIQGLDEAGHPAKNGVLEAHLSNTNAGSVIGRDWLKTAVASAQRGIRMPELEDASRDIMPGSSAGSMPSDIPGVGKDLGRVSVNGKETTARYTVTKIGDNVWRSIVGPDGQALTLKNGTVLKTTDPEQMAKWLDQLK